MRAWLLLLAVVVGLAAADCYMHNPRGSNNRLNGDGTNRANNNRLMDTQNNGKGGYCHGPSLHYYAGSLLRVEWTVQHGCHAESNGRLKTHCDMVLQYMCGDEVRDGSTTNQIPNDDTYNQRESDGSYTYGMHESRAYYQLCETRERNKGLFIADEGVNGNAARFTRQNNNGGRSGFECPEERDYYPYWHPTPWKDIAVLTTETSRCSWYKAESENVKGRHLCSNPAINNQQECQADGADWELQDAHNIDAPDCLLAPYSRDNHLGNGDNGKTNHYNWELPTDVGDGWSNCVLRLRYNVSTTDYEGWNSDSSLNGDTPVENDPYLAIFPNVNVSLAVDTSQFGRTFQDRSHVFDIVAAPSSAGRIFNLNVRGKRGNIVQAYPATEYDFVPNDLTVQVGDFVHFQWTGCDTNPNNYAGEGTDKTDRSNIVQIASLNHNYPASLTSDDDPRLLGDVSGNALFADPDLRLAMAYLDQDPDSCLTHEELLAKPENNDDDDVDRDVENCMKLNKASAYFNGGLIKMNSTGTYHYMSSRNNNYTNRGQKASLHVGTVASTWSIAAVATGGAIFGVAIIVVILKVYAASNPGSGVASMMG